ncbi:Uncharacterized conserved protein, DUF305 family [Williamsia serinedens]|uniref:Uncharacterized conserved protein, DUF305 family n=1 Tax=Williamsia serinedens TaxID=391736 RepID=A0ABT1GYS3_9NOCA|nr:Uncharacterized conserved protein, DUF305 family [Williamsia serinedens]
MTALAAGATIALTACGTSSSDTSAPAASSSASATASAGSHNAADAMFVQMMIPHHEQAVQMSDMLLAKSGIDPRVVSLAQEIKAAQAPEITTMKRWASSWGVSADGGMSMDHGSMDHGTMDKGSMSGMMSADDMNTLRSAQGVDAAKLFLNQMIQHHGGAITMGQNEIRAGKNADAKQLAQSIVTSQQREIATMRQLLTQL